MSDPAIASDAAAEPEAGAASLEDSIGADQLTSNGNGAVPITDVAAEERPAVESFLRPVPAPLPRATALRRWVPFAVCLDFVLLAAANVLFLADAGQPFSPLLLLAFDAIVVSLMATWRAYAPRLRLDALEEIRTVLTSTAVATMSVVSIDLLLSASQPSAYVVLWLWLLASALLALGRVASISWLSWRRRNSELAATTIVVGAGRVGRLTASRLLEHPEFGLYPIGFLDAEPMEIGGKPLPIPVLGTSGDLERVVASMGVDCVVVAFSSDSHDAFLGLLDECDRLGIRVLVVPRLFERVPAQVEVTHVGGLPLLEMFATSPRSVHFAVKYALDRIAALALVVLLLPVFAVITASVAVSLGRPIFYRQDRVSLDGRRFRMFKFRTMQDPHEDDHHSHEFDPQVAPGGVEGSDRRTRAGAFLRRWSLDELPQLFNVLRGDMSLVGPRPERPEYDEYFREHVRRYDGRLRTKGGITGWAQIHRLRGQTSISDRVEWDNYYIENFSLWLDLKILLRTIPEALKGRAD